MPPSPVTERSSIARALLSVSDKSGLIPFAEALVASGVVLLSTGGTGKALRAAGLPVTDVSAVTGFPEIMEGRVKTLHPMIHGGLLSDRHKEDHRAAMQQHEIAGIDLLCVNLYPFEDALASGADRSSMVETIDIGGPAMIRAGAKNHEHVTVLTDPEDYDAVIDEIRDGGPSRDRRRQLAAKAFARTAAYDAAIAGWFGREQNDPLPRHAAVAGTKATNLRYGENPHQQAALYTVAGGGPGIAVASQLQGKPLSYNNIADADAALETVAAFDEPAVAIIKHANPCGVATHSALKDAYRSAHACDPTSAFGGIVAVNRTLDEATARRIVEIFTEVVIAPDISEGARQLFAKKKNLRLLTLPRIGVPLPTDTVVKPVGGGFLLQTADVRRITRDDLKVVTRKSPTQKELDDLLFAFTVAKFVKSNAIVYAKDGATVGIGAGQMSRLDSTRIAVRKAEDAAVALGRNASLTEGAVVASDAFFPFPDGLLSAAEAGVTAVIQPGGSIRDEDVIAAANEKGLAMVFTGVRHFRH